MHPTRQEVAPGIEAGSDIVSGAPVLKGTRIPVWAIVRALADLGSIQEVAEAYEVTPQHVEEAIYYAADLLEEIRVGVLA